jgi:hypothetical protein
MDGAARGCGRGPARRGPYVSRPRRSPPLRGPARRTSACSPSACGTAARGGIGRASGASRMAERSAACTSGADLRGAVTLEARGVAGALGRARSRASGGARPDAPAKSAASAAALAGGPHAVRSDVREARTFARPKRSKTRCRFRELPSRYRGDGIDRKPPRFLQRRFRPVTGLQPGRDQSEPLYEWPCGSNRLTRVLNLRAP